MGRPGRRKGTKKTGGRKRGTPNKITIRMGGTFAEAAIEAAEGKVAQILPPKKRARATTLEHHQLRRIPLPSRLGRLFRFDDRGVSPGRGRMRETLGSKLWARTRKGDHLAMVFILGPIA